MEDSAVSALTSIFTVLCYAAMCLVPLGAVFGVITFFRKRKQAVANSVNASAAAAAAGMAGTAAPAAKVSTSADAIFPERETPAFVPAAAVGAAAPAAGARPVPAANDPFTVPLSAQAAAPLSADIAVASGAADLLAPSEIVYLRGDAFAQPTGVLNSTKLLYNDVRVKGVVLAAAVLRAAVMALVEAGDARLQPAKRKVLFKEHDTFLLVPTGRQSSWPSGSFEAALLEAANYYAAKGEGNIPYVVFRALERDATVPWSQVFDIINRALATRGLLVAQKGALGLSLKFSLATQENGYELTAARIAALDVAPVKALLDSAVQKGIAGVLEHEILEGIERRRDTSD